MTIHPFPRPKAPSLFSPFQNAARGHGLGAALVGAVLIAVTFSGSGVLAQTAQGEGKTEREPARLASDEAVRAKLEALKEVVLPEVSFRNLSLAEAVAFLETKSGDLDAAAGNLAGRTGLRVELSPEIDPKTPVSLQLKEVPWSEALRYLSALASAQIHIGSGVVILSKEPQEPALTIHLYPVNQPKKRFLESLRAGGNTITEALVRDAIPMPPGSGAVLNPSTSQLIVRHTAEGHRQVQAWLSAKP